MNCRVECIAGCRRSRELRVAAAKLPDGRNLALRRNPTGVGVAPSTLSGDANFELSHPRRRLSLTITRARADKSTLPTSPGLSLNAVTHYATEPPTRHATATRLLTSTHAQSQGLKGNVFGI